MVLTSKGAGVGDPRSLSSVIWAGMSGLQGLGHQEVGEPGEVSRAESEGPGSGPNFPLQGRQGSRGCIPGSPGESGLVSRGSQGLRSVRGDLSLQSRRWQEGAQLLAGMRARLSGAPGHVVGVPLKRPALFDRSPERSPWRAGVQHVGRLPLQDVTPWRAAHQAPPSLGFSRQEKVKVLLICV